MKAYSRVLYAAAPVRPGDTDAGQVVADLLDLFFHEHRSRHKGVAQTSVAGAAAGDARSDLPGRRARTPSHRCYASVGSSFSKVRLGPARRDWR